MVYCLHGIFSQIILLYIFSLNYLVVNRKNKLNCTTEETTDKSAIDKIRRIKFTRAHTHFIHFDIKDTKNLSFEQEVLCNIRRISSNKICNPHYLLYNTLAFVCRLRRNVK